MSWQAATADAARMDVQARIADGFGAAGRLLGAGGHSPPATPTAIGHARAPISENDLGRGPAQALERLLSWFVLDVINRLPVALGAAITVWALIFAAYLQG